MHASNGNAERIGVCHRMSLTHRISRPINRRIAPGRLFEWFDGMIGRMSRALRRQKASPHEARLEWIPVTRPSRLREQLEHR